MMLRHVRFFKQTALISAFILLLGTSILSAPAQAVVLTPQSLDLQNTQNVGTVTKPQDKALIAHCGLEGCPVAAGQLMTTSTTSTMSSNAPFSDSLWGNLILSMAYQRDPELQVLMKKMGRVNMLTLTSVAAISALAITQGVTTLHTLNDEPHKKYPVVIGMVGSGASLAALGIRGLYSHHYTKKIQARQIAIKQKVEGILTQFEVTEPTEDGKNQLAALIGPRATQEFMMIWQAAHSQTKPNSEASQKQPQLVTK